MSWKDEDVVQEAWTDADVAEAPKAQPASVFKRALTGLLDPIIGVGQLIDRAARATTGAGGAGQTNMDDVVRQREAEYQAPEGFDFARIAGNIANPINYLGGGSAAIAGAPTLAARARAAVKGAAPTLKRSAATGASQGAMAPVVSDDYWQEKAQQAGIGAGIGAGGHALARTIGGLVRPTAEARTLMDAGVVLTPGQAAGAGSLMGRTEQSFASLPLAGHFIKGAQRRAVEESNVAAAQAVTNMVDNSVRLGKSPREAIEQTHYVIGKTYDQALEGMTMDTASMYKNIAGSLDDIAVEHPMVSKKDIGKLKRYVSTRFDDFTSNGLDTLSGGQLKTIDSEIGGQVRNLKRSALASDRDAAYAWADLQQQVRDVMEQAAKSPEQYEQLKGANDAYRHLLALEKSLLPGADTFTPRRLAASLDRARINSGALRGISNAMTKTLPNVVPDSGTAERLLTAGLPAMLMGGGAGATGMGYGNLGAGMMAAGALGSRSGARLMTGKSKVPFTNYEWQQKAEAMINALRRGVVPATRDDD